MSSRSSSSSSSSLESLEELGMIIDLIHDEKKYQEHANPFETYDEAEFKLRFRFSKQAVQNFLQLIDTKLEPVQNKRGLPVSKMNQLLLALRFYATVGKGVVQGDLMHVHQSTVSRIVCRVTNAIASLCPEFIKMPTTRRDSLAVQVAFHDICGFPNVCGSIDCTHIKIESPGGENAELYRNRKGYFSINVQVVCDANLKILDIVARYPGSVHDSTIFNNSLLRARFENNEFEGAYLLGDGGYACRKYLLTPLLNPQTPAERRYNQCQIRTRNTVERCFGVLKRRFPCLSLGLRLKLGTTLAVIVATSVLHNYAIDINEEQPESYDDGDEPSAEVEVPVEVNAEPNQNAERRMLINTTFST